MAVTFLDEKPKSRVVFLDEDDSPSGGYARGDISEEEMLRLQLEAMDGPTAEIPERPKRTAGETAIGVLENAASLGSGMVSGMTRAPLSAAQNMAEVWYDTATGNNPKPYQRASEAARNFQEDTARFTYEPRTDAGRDQQKVVGEFMNEYLAPLEPALAAMDMAPMLPRGALRQAIPDIPRRQAPSGGAGRNAGAAESAMAAQRLEAMQSLPRPFEGDSAPTRGQLSRAFDQVQFERETAKQPELGAPLRERYQNQQGRLAENLDAIQDNASPSTLEPRAIASGAVSALDERRAARKQKVADYYADAEEAGALAAPIDMAPISRAVSQGDAMQSVAPNAKAIKDEAVRLGALVPDENGKLVPQRITIGQAEKLRQFVNYATDYYTPREKRVATEWIKGIERALDSGESVNGEANKLYRRARSERKRFAQEFEEVPIVRSLLDNKRGTSERVVPLDKLFNRTILNGSVEEINKLRGSLLQSGEDGKQAWMNLKAQTIEHIKEKGFSRTQDSAGNPVVTPNQLSKVIDGLDKSGKLESLFGRKQAQQLRDLSDSAQYIFTAPPNAVNHSNTGAILLAALDSFLSVGIGMPAPVATLGRAAAAEAKRRKVRSGVTRALEGEVQ